MKTLHLLPAAGLLGLLGACAAPPAQAPHHASNVSATPGSNGQSLEAFYQQQLDARQVDYHHALRIASLKLRGTTPTLMEIRALSQSLTPSQTYAGIVRNMLNGLDAQGQPDNGVVAANVRDFWRNTLRLGAPANTSIGAADADAAANMAAMVTLSDSRPFSQLFTLPSDDCYTLNSDGTFSSSKCTCTGGACFGANPPQAGVLANPAWMAINISNMSFHRVRMVQEVFVCRPMPAEAAGVWDVAVPPPSGFTSSLQSAPINFTSTDGVVCAKCHQTMNRQAALFGVFDDKGKMVNSGGGCANFPTACDFQVSTPVTPPRASKLSDYLVPLAGNANPVFGWRANAQGSDLTALGAAVAADPEVARCLVNRLWYWVMSRRDIVSDPVRPPPSMTDAWVAVLNSNTDPLNGQPRTPGTLKAVLLSMLTSNDFVSF